MAMNLRQALLQSTRPEPKRRKLSTGLTLCNLLLSGDCSTGIESGSVVWVSGPSDSGRSTVGLTLLAEASQNADFAGYDLFYNNTEGQQVDLAAYFGTKVAERIRRAGAATHDSFWGYLLLHHRPCVYFLDSLDGLNGTDGWQKNNDKAKAAFDTVRDRDSILIIASQEKNVGEKKVAAGGYAVQFYADYGIKTTRLGLITRVIRGKERAIGINTSLSISKSRHGLQKITTIPAPIFSGSGYDNAESLFMYLRRKGFIKENAGLFEWPLFGLKGRFDGMLQEIRTFEPILSSWLESHFQEI